MPPEMRAQIPVRDLLEGHQMKMMGALLLLILDGARPGVASRVTALPLADVLRTTVSQASTANAAKQRGFYADLMADGTSSLPSDVTESDARAAVAQACAVASSAALLHDKEALAGFADPSASEARGTDDVDAVAALLADLAAGLATG
jgi:hypothetical protein